MKFHAIKNFALYFAICPLLIEANDIPPRNIQDSITKLEDDLNTKLTTDGPTDREEYGDNASEETIKRQNKMIGYYGYFEPRIFRQQPIVQKSPILPQPFFIPYNLNSYPPLDEERNEDIHGRSNRKRPSYHPEGYENSPIYYIRLPPTPYMLVPGIGYISQPPSIESLNQVPAMHHAPPPISPLLNLPVNFISNGKPSNIYQFGSDFRPQYTNSPYFPSSDHPFYRPKPFQTEPKVTSLKGSFLYNGRPEDIFVLPNNMDAFYSSQPNSFY